MNRSLHRCKGSNGKPVRNGAVYSQVVCMTTSPNRHGPSFTFALVLAGCAGTIATDPEPAGTGNATPTMPGKPGPGAGAGGGPGLVAGPEGGFSVANPPPPAKETPAPIGPEDLNASCKLDSAHPRRALRLSNAEIVASLRAISPFNDAGIPQGFAVAGFGSKPDDRLSVSLDFHGSVDSMASAVAAKISASPGSNQLAVLPCPVTDFGKNEACTTTFLTAASARLLRGMATPQDVTKLFDLVKGIAQRSDGKTAIEYAVRALALHPKAVYLLEGLDLPAGANPGTPSFLSAGEMASLVSYRILGKPPQPQLLMAFQTIKTAPTLAAIQQIIANNFSLAELQKGATDFFAAWLNVDDVSRLVRDRKKHPMVNDAFLLRLQTETYDAIAKAMSAPQVSFADVLTNEQRVASTGDNMSTFIPKFGRPGLFTLPGVIATVSTVDHTDIPRRGRYLLKQLFCDTVPSPPANLTTSLPPLPGTPSERQRFERIEMEPTCGGCHRRVNGLGFALENYNEMGVVRADDEYKNPIVTAASHLVGEKKLAFADAKDLFAQAATHPVVQNCLAIQAFRYFARRDERGAEDACLIRDVAASGRAKGFGLIDMFTDTVARTVFAKRGN